MSTRGVLLRTCIERPPVLPVSLPVRSVMVAECAASVAGNCVQKYAASCDAKRAAAAMHAQARRAESSRSNAASSALCSAGSRRLCACALRAVAISASTVTCTTGASCCGTCRMFSTLKQLCTLGKISRKVCQNSKGQPPRHEVRTSRSSLKDSSRSASSFSSRASSGLSESCRPNLLLALSAPTRDCCCVLLPGSEPLAEGLVAAAVSSGTASKWHNKACVPQRAWCRSWHTHCFSVSRGTPACRHVRHLQLACSVSVRLDTVQRCIHQTDKPRLLCS